MNFHICINILIGGRLKIWNFKSMILKYFKGQHTKVFENLFIFVTFMDFTRRTT